MRFPSIEILFPLTLIAAMAPLLPAHAQQLQEQDAFARGQVLYLGELDIRLDKDQSRWGETRQGNIDLNRNTFLFGREDTYETLASRSGIDQPEKGATIGVGMGFTF